MTLDSYRNFVTIVDCGSIVAAANKLLIAQPSLSNQLKNIEKTYGAKLLLRGNSSEKPAFWFSNSFRRPSSIMQISLARL